MNDYILTLISFIGSLLGSLAGIVTSAKLTTYRIEQLEKKVDKHNNFAEKIPVILNRLDVTDHRLKDLEEKIK